MSVNIEQINGNYNIKYLPQVMQYVSALALANLSGKAPTKDSLIAILKATGKPVDEAQVNAVLTSLNNRKVDDVISKGLSKVSLGAPASGPAPAKKEQKKQEPKKKEEPKKEEPKKKEPEPAAEEEGDFGLDLFG